MYEIFFSFDGTMRNYYNGNHILGAILSDTNPLKFASRLQARRPKYISLLNHLRIYIPVVYIFIWKEDTSDCSHGCPGLSMTKSDVTASEISTWAKIITKPKVFFNL